MGLFLAVRVAGGGRWGPVLPEVGRSSRSPFALSLVHSPKTQKTIRENAVPSLQLRLLFLKELVVNFMEV